jgi:hypothetical protein
MVTLLNPSDSPHFVTLPPPQEIDYIMMTGDNPPHDVWLQSRDNNLDHSRKVAELINKVFPDKQESILSNSVSAEKFADKFISYYNVKISPKCWRPIYV